MMVTLKIKKGSKPPGNGKFLFTKRELVRVGKGIEYREIEFEIYEIPDEEKPLDKKLHINFRK